MERGDVDDISLSGMELRAVAEYVSDQIQSIVAENIRKYRIENGFTQDDVARGLCSVSQLSKIENGKVPIKLDLLKEIAKRLGVSSGQLQVVDSIEQELNEELELYRNALMVNQMDMALRYARSVINRARKHGSTELMVEGIFAECRVLNWATRFDEMILRLKNELFVEHTPLSDFHKLRLYMELAHAYLRVGNVEHARDYFRTAEDMYHEQRAEKIEHPSVMNIALRLASIHMDMHNYRTALPYVREGRRLAGQQDQLNWKFFAICAEAELLWRVGNYDQAEQLYVEGLESAQKLKMIGYIAAIQNNLGCLYIRIRRLGEAQSLFKRSIKNFELASGTEGKCEAVLNLAEVALLNENESAAREYIEQASDLLEKYTIGLKYTARRHVLLSRLYQSRGDVTRGIELLENALRTYEEHCAFYEAYGVACQLADLHYGQGDPLRATEYYRQAIRYDRRLGSIW